MSINIDERANPTANDCCSADHYPHFQLLIRSDRTQMRQDLESLTGDESRQINFKSEIDLEMDAIFDSIPVKKKSVAKKTPKNPTPRQRTKLEEHVGCNLGSVCNSSKISEPCKPPELENSNNDFITKDSSFYINHENVN